MCLYVPCFALEKTPLLKKVTCVKPFTRIFTLQYYNEKIINNKYIVCFEMKSVVCPEHRTLSDLSCFHKQTTNIYTTGTIV